MTIGERNKNIVRLHESGLTTKQTAEIMKCTETTAEKVLSRYNKDGEKVFESMREWTPEAVEEESVECDAYDYFMNGMRTEGFASDFNRKIEILKRTIKVGDAVKIGGSKRMVVEEKHPFLVYGHNKNNPCWMCRNRSICKVECDKHKEYMYYRLPITMTYVQLLEAGN